LRHAWLWCCGNRRATTTATATTTTTGTPACALRLLLLLLALLLVPPAYCCCIHHHALLLLFLITCHHHQAGLCAAYRVLVQLVARCTVWALHQATHHWHASEAALPKPSSAGVLTADCGAASHIQPAGSKPSKHPRKTAAGAAA
jgi:hypothetical protein